MTDRPERWRTVSKKTLADCRVFEVTERESESESGQTASFYVIESPEWVNIVPVTADGEVVLIEQYRHGTEEVTLEIPGGLIDEGESPAECAGRELTEETGYTGGELIYLGFSWPNPAIQSNRIHHFAALGCTDGAAQKFDEHESIRVRRVPVGELTGLVEAGAISHSLVLAGLLKFQNYMARRKTQTYES